MPITSEAAGTWGAERIRGELLKLGLRVAKRTIQSHIRAVRPPGDGQRWRTFLKSHTVWACDFIQTYDIWFRPLFAFFVVDVNTKQVIHVAVTREPNERWTAHQLRQLTPFGTAPHFIIRDRDAKFGSEFDRVAKSSGIRVLKTAFRSPLMNATCERFLGSVRRECLDHLGTCQRFRDSGGLISMTEGPLLEAVLPGKLMVGTRSLSFAGQRSLTLSSGVSRRSSADGGAASAGLMSTCAGGRATVGGPFTKRSG